jgi:DNA-directed RNA polymerase subunit RPC12/RpoP
MSTIIPTAGFCPITRRDPAACVYSGFRQACARFFAKRSEKTGSSLYPPCRPVPTESKRIETTPETEIPPQKEIAMADSSKGSSKKCASCGKQKNLISHLGKNVCASCMAIRIAAKNKPELVVAALREFDTFPKISASRQENTDAITELEILRTENASLVEEVKRLRESDGGIGNFLGKHLLADGKGISIDIRPIREAA